MVLKYLFRATFEDGEVFNQNADDISLIEPTRSAYFDLLAKNKKIVKFELLKDSETVVFVDLINGEIDFSGDLTDCVQFDEIPIYEIDIDLRLVFYRQHTVDTTGRDDVVYFTGWQTTVDGKNYQRLIGFK